MTHGDRCVMAIPFSSCKYQEAKDLALLRRLVEQILRDAVQNSAHQEDAQETRANAAKYGVDAGRSVNQAAADHRAVSQAAADRPVNQAASDHGTAIQTAVGRRVSQAVAINHSNNAQSSLSPPRTSSSHCHSHCQARGACASSRSVRSASAKGPPAVRNRATGRLVRNRLCSSVPDLVADTGDADGRTDALLPDASQAENAVAVPDVVPRQAHHGSRDSPRAKDISRGFRIHGLLENPRDDFRSTGRSLSRIADGYRGEEGEAGLPAGAQGLQGALEVQIVRALAQHLESNRILLFSLGCYLIYRAFNTK